VSGTTFFIEDVNLQKTCCGPIEDYCKRGTEWQLANLEVFYSIDVMVTDDRKGNFSDFGTVKPDLLSAVFTE
jgi:hypothetical protein